MAAAQPVPDPAPGEEQMVHRPIEEFLASQGTYCVDDGSGGCMMYAPPVANYLAWFDPNHDRTIAIDYAGIVSRWMEASGQPIGTHVAGSVIEHIQADGRTRVTVDLQVHNGSSYMVQGRELQGGVIFGQRPGDPFMGPRHQALGDVHMHLVYMTQHPGAPLADLVQLVTAPEPGQEILEFQFTYDGRWMAPGSMGAYQRVHVAQHGPFHQAFPGEPHVAPMGIAFIEVMKE
jgi:hypothetical protein